MMKSSTFLLLTALLALGATLGGCFGRGDVREEVAAAPLRSPYPTFTPTPRAPATATAPAPAAPVGDAAAESATDSTTDSTTDSAPGSTTDSIAAPASDSAPAPQAILSTDLVNIRRGPGLEYPPIKLGMRGDQFTITGRSADDLWWQICCVEELPAWISKTYVDSEGDVDGVPVADPAAAAQEGVVRPTEPTPAPAPPPVQEAPTAPPAPEATVAPAPEATAAPPAPTFPFALAAQETFPEGNNLVRVFLYVYQGEQAIPGYTLSVTKDGAPMPVSGVSADTSGMTWPTASPRQRFQNLKVEFPGVSPGGVWVIQLVDGGGAPVGPPATFTLAATDLNRELYVRYEKQ